MSFASVKSNSPGKAASDSNKSDMKLPQYGGEGRSLKTGKGSMAYTPGKDQKAEYCGPGRYLNTKSF